MSFRLRRQATRRYSDKGWCPKGEILLNRYEARDVEREGDEGEEHHGHGEVKE